MTTRIAVFGDLHGNSAATEAVLAAIDAEAPDRIVCLGDLVGYGARPNEVIDRIRRRDIPTIMGNYDDGVGFDRDDCGCAYKDAGEEARGQQSLMWTRRPSGNSPRCTRRRARPLYAADGGSNATGTAAAPRPASSRFRPSAESSACAAAASR